MVFLPNTDKIDIVNALLSGQSKIVIDRVEYILPRLKRDTYKNKEKEANKIAEDLLKIK